MVEITTVSESDEHSDDNEWKELMGEDLIMKVFLMFSSRIILFASFLLPPNISPVFAFVSAYISLKIFNTCPLQMINSCR